MTKDRGTGIQGLAALDFRLLGADTELEHVQDAVDRGDLAEAVGCARRAARLFPWDARVAGILGLLGQEGDVATVQRRLSESTSWRRTSWHLSRIPRKMHFYWGNESTSFLRYLSVYSFRKLNPDWEVNLYVPARGHGGEASWASWESYDRAHFTGRDYSRELFSLPGLRVREVDFSAFPGMNGATEVHKSDFFRWHLLGEEGGVYSDIDILYFRPFEELAFNLPDNRDAEAVLCLHEHGHIIGFFMASAGNAFFRGLAESALEYLDSQAYQSIGSLMLNKLYPDEEAIRRGFPGMRWLNLPLSVVYPYDWSQATNIFQSRDASALQPDTIGVHWFAGSPITRQFNNLIDAETYPEVECMLCDLIAQVYSGPLPGSLGLASAPPAAPTFSILVPSYNQAGLLMETLDSLLAQGRSDWEALVVNDGSTDETPRVMQDYAARDPRIRTFHKANGGCGSALNEGLRHARGRWVCWLSSDDLYEPDALEIFTEAIERNPEARFHYSNFYQLFHESGERVAIPSGRGAELPKPETQVIAFLKANYVNGISICIQKSLFDEVGFFDERLHYAQDFDMWLRMSARTPFHFIDERPCVTRMHLGQDTQGFPEARDFDSARACLAFLNQNPFTAIYPFLDLRSPGGIGQAVQLALATALDLDSWMYMGVGYEPALLERLGEWLDDGCPQDVARTLREGLATLGSRLESCPAALRETILRIAQGGPVRFLPRDPVTCMRSNLAVLEARGFSAPAALLRRYLEQVVDRRRSRAPIPSRSRPGLISEAYFLELGNSQEDWHPVVRAFLQAFLPKDPVCLALTRDMAEPGGATAEEVKAEVEALAVEAGKPEHPPILCLMEPEALWETLRAYTHVQWVPVLPPADHSLVWSYGARFLKALKVACAQGEPVRG